MINALNACASTCANPRAFDIANMFKSHAIAAAYQADDAFQRSLDASGLDRWTTQPDAMPEAVQAARAAKHRADAILNLAYALDRGERPAVDVEPLLTVADELAEIALHLSDSLLTNVAVLNAIAGFGHDLTARQWADVFGGPVTYGQGALPESIWQRVKTVRRGVEIRRNPRAA